MKYDFIYFDSGGTLYGAWHSAPITMTMVRNNRIQRVQSALAGFGVEVCRERLNETLTKLEQSTPQKYGAGYNFFRLIQELLQELQLDLGIEEAACIADAYAGPRYASWLFDGTVAALSKLNTAGYRMGIIANTWWPGFTMDRAFNGVGLIPYLGIRVYSGDIAIEKPDPAIFHYAERLCGLSGKRILYVGNDINCDVRGANNVGWSTAFRRGNPPTTNGEADFEFDHIDELVAHCLS
ncbi:MAG: HAD family hydrolase [Lentisphaerae bacterium]|jgi:putative hydrolase of the HAD superfamily|nr:HAD family hydrolase [Lentisphaerota bacterium]